jgi:hypothetical protein
MYRFFALVSAGAIVLAAGATSAQTIVESSFESPSVGSGGYAYDPSLIGATFTGNAGVDAGGFGFATPPDGVQDGFLQSVGAASSFSLDVSGLTIGDSYTLAYYAANRPSYGIETVSVSSNEGSLGSFTPSDTAWVQVTGGSFTATATTDVLTFSVPAAWGDSDIGIDQVTLNGLGGGGGAAPGGVPEPATWSLMLVGVGALGSVLRSRRRVAAATA